MRERAWSVKINGICLFRTDELDTEREDGRPNVLTLH